MGNNSCAVSAPMKGVNAFSGRSGITDCTPAALSRSTASVASESVLAVSPTSAVIVTTWGVMPAFLRSGSRKELSASWSLTSSETTTPTFLPWPRRPELSPHRTVAARMGASSAPVHHR